MPVLTRSQEKLLGRRMAYDWSGFYERLRQAWQVNTDQALAEIFQIPYGAWRTAKSTGGSARYYRKYLAAYTELKTGYRMGWIESGELPERTAARRLDSLPASLQEALGLVHDLPATHATMAHCARVLASGEPRWIETLTNVAEGLQPWIEESRRARQALQARVSEPK